MRLNRWVPLMLVGCGATGTSTDGTSSTLPDPQDWPQDWKDAEDEVLQLVNDQRFVGGNCGGTQFFRADPLEMDDTLQAVARAYSQKMAQQDFFEHTDPGGHTPEDRVLAAGFTGAYPIGENIAEGYATPDDVVAGWMASPGHCSNILEPSFGVIGVGLYEDGTPSGYWWTQDFAGSH